MLHRMLQWRVIVVLLFLLPMLPGSTAAAQGTDGTWASPSFGFELAWSDDWAINESLNMSIPGTFDLVTLFHSDGAFVMVSALPGTIDSLAELMEPADTATIVEDNRDAAVPSVLSDDAGSRTLSEGYVIEDVAINVLISAPTTVFDDALASAQDGITINSAPVLSGQPLQEGVTDLTETPTATTTTRTTRTTRATPTPTESATATTTTRTTRTTQETPTPVEQDGTYTGPLYGYTLTYDPAIWTNEATRDSATADGIQLSTNDGILDIWAWNGYGADPIGCLQGEESYYPENVDGISQWEQATDANGNPLRYEGEDSAWGVFTYAYTNSSGRDVPLVDYISCQPIPNQDAVLVVHLSALPESYNDVLDLTLDIVDSLQFADAPAPTQEPTVVPTEETTPETTVTAEATEATGSQISTNVDGTVYTSPSYGFTMDVPLEWAIVNETSESGNDTLVLNNGTSIVTVWATNATVGDLSGCVDYAANQSGLDLVLDETSAGGAFRGEYGDQAFGNFVYQDGDVKMMYFVGCQEIPGTDAHLIVIQQVEYSQFTAERRFRSQLESSIQFP